MSDVTTSREPHSFTYWIGYRTLEGWLEAISREEPIYGLPMMQREWTGGMETRLHYVLLCQIDPRGNVIYFRVNTARGEFIANQPFGSLSEGAIERAMQFWVLLQTLLSERDIRIIEAMIDLPKDGLQIVGSTTEIMWSEESQQYERVEV